jgi:hypothetical protein
MCISLAHRHLQPLGSRASGNLYAGSNHGGIAVFAVDPKAIDAKKSLRVASSHPCLRFLGIMMVVLFGSAGQAYSRCSNPANPIVAENCLPGNPDSEWDVSTKNAGDPTIQGFASDISVNQGGTVFFKISTPATAYTINIYRMGYYGGMGARKVAIISPSVPLPQKQPACITDATTKLFDCGNWGVSASWQVPAIATSGIYFAHLVRTDTGGDSHIVFIVRNDSSHSAVLYQLLMKHGRLTTTTVEGASMILHRRPSMSATDLTRSATTAPSLRGVLGTNRLAGCSALSSPWFSGLEQMVTT